VYPNLPVLTGPMPTKAVSSTEVSEGIRRLGIAGAQLCLHASLRSFPRLVEGPATLVGGILETGGTVMVATMANRAFEIPAPLEDRPRRNGIDYAELDALASANPWPALSDTYDASRSEVDAALGSTSAYVANRPDRIRCRFPTGTFSAVGPLAAQLIGAEVATDTFGPMRELASRSGWVLLAGVTLRRMTILHLAETEAGRRPFIRWARGPDGRPIRSAGGGCSEGFERLAGLLRGVERRCQVGESFWRAFPAREAVAIASEAILTDPSITHCDDPNCRECADAIAGGPIDR
jgi:aminoglycoside N3'-acetyltransferase